MLLSTAFAILLGTQVLPPGFVSTPGPNLQPAQPAKPPQSFGLKDGDRIVWLGNTLVEREQRYGYWETALIAANADKNITVRNLGWSGDTVFGDARAGFDNAAKGYERMVSLTLELKPTVIFVNFGSNEAFEGKEGLPKFEKGLEKLLDSLKPANARVFLFTPIPVEKSTSLPDPKALNDKLALYSGAIKAIAEKRGISFVDLFRDFQNIRSAGPFTDNGIHLTEAGYKQFTPFFTNSLAQPGTVVSEEKLEPLRQAIIAKNEQFFNKWRPQNETYLFGFRKHEQGKNAKEIVEFDPFIAKAEEEIANIRKSLSK
ncbi:GDSL-like Lipase/Acylhydrolase [Gemmata sp. SH-PL17]|uniref:SGNH/GDSL hydrolase family protein n=1 Tax=Gemmata sp. SH-PL17 TaxID=1630693 RepID=UPI00078DD3B3|nr:SGNH/GDSL hydrolase family protein [Gemmata sp. SH-PL17]AMV26146.1 GDSL-like Lipase/Acylhydrolase [Gemmata sp. SH-PL17]